MKSSHKAVASGQVDKHGKLEHIKHEGAAKTAEEREKEYKRMKLRRQSKKCSSDSSYDFTCGFVKTDPSADGPSSQAAGSKADAATKAKVKAKAKVVKKAAAAQKATTPTSRTPGQAVIATAKLKAKVVGNAELRQTRRRNLQAVRKMMEETKESIEVLKDN